jgi:Zn-dependent M28 family amino/carboxypeptidase
MPLHEREPELPVHEITEAVASRLLGEDVAALAERIDRTGKPLRRDLDEVTVYLEAGFEERAVSMDNVVGLLRGSDEDLATEYVVLGAHYDHLGVDPWGRIAYGADDNASGSAAVLEVAEALAAAGPRRSVLFAFFAAEEDGLIGSTRFCEEPPVPRDALVAMINMDMLGRGEVDEVYVLGTDQNPGFEELLVRARKLEPTRVKKVVTDTGRDFWERSDHFPFHEIGVPVLFFFENYPETENPDYHTYRDTIESVDCEKITRSTRIIFNTAWLLTTDDERPEAPR